jgi:hypothetical protein
MMHMAFKSAQELIENPECLKPHVVLLGAGASKAAFPKGDALGNELPVMDDLVDKLDLNGLLKNSGFDPTENFETIYSRLEDNGIKVQIEKKIAEYFSELKLPDTVTIYDQLLLSLRNKDAIFTFNWDPFLFDAYQRNRYIAPLPHIYFLHGNVRIGECESCNSWGMKSILCHRCKIKFKDVPLLYPVEKKCYFEGSPYTAMSWKEASWWFSQAFTVTIFGYSAPKSDQEAVKLLEKAWFKTSERQFEHVEVIDIMCEDLIREKWKKFTPTLHLIPQKTFQNSRLWDWPRRSCEALLYPMAEGLPCENFPLPINHSLKELHYYIREISRFESVAN